MTFFTMIRKTFFLASILLISGTASAQNWIDMGPFPPDSSFTYPTHGIAVDAEGKVWIDQFSGTPRLDANGDTLKDASGDNLIFHPIYVYNPDGTMAMDPIDALGGDTLGTFGGGRPFVGGMKTDPNGDILVALRHPTLSGLLYRLDHRTGEVIDRFQTDGYSLASPGVDASGNIYYANVGAPGSAIAISDPSFNVFLGLVTPDQKFGIGRNVEVSADGNTVYWANSVATQAPGLVKFTRPDEFSPYTTNFSSEDTTGIVHPGLTSESSTRHPTTGHLWFGHAQDCCGSAVDSTNYTFLSWYGIDPATDEIVDSLNFNLPTDYAGENTRAIAFSPDGLYAYVGIFNAGQPNVKKFMRGAVTNIQRDPVEIPDGFTLSQNYPNPFNPQTNIEFEIKDAGLATLKVYDMLGREVATLIDEHLVAGKYTATFNAANSLTSGTYVYQLDVAGHRLSGKMMLVK